MTSSLENQGFSDVEEAALVEMRGYREASEEGGGDTLESTPLDRPWSEVISRRAYDFVVRWETGGRPYYEQAIKGRPVWPEYASGITIGCGYDLGYHTLAQFQRDWGGRLPAAEFERLVPAIGFKTAEPNRAAKVVKAKAFVVALKDIVVGWDLAMAQFDESKMPKLVGDLYGALDNLDRLHPHSRGAVLSLVFNRGHGGFTADGARYRELREIRRLMLSGTRADFEKIPEQLLSMRRIWGPNSSLSTRRKEEADLFELGLAEASLTESIFVLGEAPVALESPGGQVAEDHLDVAVQSDEVGDETEAPEEVFIEAPGFTVDDVKWNPSDDDQPDYRHLPKPGAGTEFELTAEDIELLVRSNAFQVKPGLLVFALRGARIVGADKRENVTSVTLVDQRPDHRDYRCVIGVLDGTSKRIWAFKASTVPNANALVTGYRKAQQGIYEGNMLPTGCYTYTVGIHRAGTSGEIRGVLRLSQDSTGASVVIALRSTNDVVYDRRDFWHKCAPADNIHPGRRQNGFSSLGCLTLPGDYVMASRKHTGLWADFRVALGMGQTFENFDNGKQFSVMVLTGLDAALASSLRSAGETDDREKVLEALVRLRFGSQGDAVAKLQQKLGLAPDNSKLIGPVTRLALIIRQQEVLGWADGILSPEIDATLGLGVLS
ncbi:MAG: hypothetical protein JWR51_3443 [Devosia sp.]|uniref:hypothetical protein n=1 Tax=Devosia sp. TaxID=1871048 RepID=UPI00260DC57E|nr:hypothetical protein [Devosia sp.]MDB5530340.1 hypothetical protein [Devosia sp.]